jgi:hypothetical protein
MREWATGILVGVAILAAVLYPRWIVVHPVATDLRQHLGRNFLYAPPPERGTVLVDRRGIISDTMIILISGAVLLAALRWLEPGTPGPAGWPGVTREWDERLGFGARDGVYQMWWPIGMPRTRSFLLMTLHGGHWTGAVIARIDLQSRSQDRWAWAVLDGATGQCRGLAAAMYSVRANLVTARGGAGPDFFGTASSAALLDLPRHAWLSARFTWSLAIFTVQVLWALIRPAGRRRRPPEKTASKR